MPVRERQHALGTLQKTPRGEERFNPDISSPIRCKACSRLMDPSYALEHRSACPNCNTRFKRKEWAEMAAEAMQVKTQGGWNRDTLERFEDEQEGNAAYIAPDGTTSEQDDVARRMAEWAVAAKRRQRKLQKVKMWGGSGVNNILMSNPYK